jgi:hypothetical protein
MGSASILLAVRGILPRTERVSLRKANIAALRAAAFRQAAVWSRQMPAIAIAIIASSEIYALAVEG